MSAARFSKTERDKKPWSEKQPSARLCPLSLWKGGTEDAMGRFYKVSDHHASHDIGIHDPGDDFSLT